MARRSASLAAQAYISSYVFGGVRTSNRPNAFRGPLTPGDQLGHAHDRVDAVLFAEMRHQLNRIAVEDHRLLTGLTDVDGHHVGFDGRKSIQAKLFGDLRGCGKLHRSGDLVAESVDEFDCRGHSTAIGIGFQTQRAQARTLQDGCGRQAVVPGSDDDRVIVSHGTQNMSVLTQCEDVSPDALREFGITSAR